MFLLQKKQHLCQMKPRFPCLIPGFLEFLMSEMIVWKSMSWSYINEQKQISKITLWLSSRLEFDEPPSLHPTCCPPFHPLLALSHSHHSCCLCGFPSRWQAAGKNPQQHNSSIRPTMSTEGEIKMKEGRSSGEARRQQAFMRPVLSDDESKEKQNSSEVPSRLKTLGWCLMRRRGSERIVSARLSSL